MDDTLQNAAAWLEAPAGKRMPVCGNFLIGRSPANNLVVNDDKASRRHAMIHCQNENEYWLIDLGSSNGSFVNSRRVAQPCQLADRDQIRIGEHSFTFCQPTRARAGAAGDQAAEKTIQDVKSMDCWLLVADIEGSTALIRKLPPDEAPRVTGRWLADCKQVIDECEGTINKFLGDGFFAFWPNEPGCDVRVLKALDTLKALQGTGHPRFRIVLHHGRVFMGGTAMPGEDSLLGGEVNFVFRMEKLAASLNTLRLVSHPVHELFQDRLPVTPAGQHSVSGFDGEFAFFSF